MKKFVKIFVPVAVAAIALVSCAKETKVPVSEEGVRISVTAGIEKLGAKTPEAKTYIGTYQGTPNTIMWGSSEFMKLAVTAGTKTVFATSKEADWNGDKEAMFEFEITPDQADSYLYQGIYPASAAVAGNNNDDPAAYKVELPSSQNATAESYDPAAYILVAQPKSFTQVETEWLASFRRATALNKVTLTGLNADIVSVEFIAPDPVALSGRRYINIATGADGDVYLGNNKLKVKYATALTGASKAVWFTSWNASILEGEDLTIVASSATHTYTRTITARAGGILFKQGWLNTLSVDMSSAVEEAIVNVSGNYLVAGIKAGKWSLMDSANESNYFKEFVTDIDADAAAVTYDDFDGIADIDDYVWTLAAVEGGYTIKNGYNDIYLALTSDENKAYAASDVDDSGNTTLFAVTYDASTKVGVINSVAYGERNLNYNSGNTRFAFYKPTSNMAPVYLIPAVSDPRTKVTLSFATAEVELTTANAGSYQGQAVSSDPSVADVLNAVEYSWDADAAFGSIDEDSGALLLSGVAGSATVTATFAGDANYRAAKATYTVSVVDASVQYYVKVTSEPANWAGQYLIVYEDNSVAFDGSLDNLDSTPNTFAVDITSGKIAITQTTIAKQFTVAEMEGGYSILAANGLYIGRTSADNGLNTSDSPLLNVFSWGTGPVITSSGGKTLGFNKSSGQEKFRYLGNSDIALYKYTDNRQESGIAWSSSSAAATIQIGGSVAFTAPTLSNPHGLQVQYASSKTNVATINETTGVIEVLAAGKSTITASFSGDATYKFTKVSYVLTVTDENNAGNDGSLEHPYTAEEAYNIIDGYESGTGGEGNVYVRGTVVSVSGLYNNTSLTYYISEDGTTTHQVQVFRGKYFGGADFTSASQVSVGDVVVVIGQLYKYNSTYEINSGNTLYSINGLTKALPAPVVTVTPDNDNKTIEVSWGAVSGASSYDVVCGDKSQLGLTVTTCTFTMDDFGSYYVTVTAKADDAVASSATVLASLVDQTVVHTPVADGTVLLAEDFSDFASGDTPSASAAHTTVYGDGSLVYACVNGGSDTKIYEETSAGGESPELLVSKSGGKFTIQGIPTGWSEKISVVYNSNNTNLGLSSGTTGVTVGSKTSSGKVYLVHLTTTGAQETFDLSFTNSNSSSNSRLDNIQVLAGEFTLLSAPVISLTKSDANKTITVSWGAVTGATSYDVTCGTQSQTGITGTSHTFTMSDYGSYNVTVTAKSVTGIPATSTSSIELKDPSISSTAYTYSFTIQASDFNTTSYAANNGEHTATATCTTDNSRTLSIKWYSNQVYQSSSLMQWQKNTGYIYNVTDLGTILSVTVNSSAGTFTKYYGTSSHPTSGTTVGDGYFTVAVGNATGKTSSIVVTFEK